MGLISTIKEKFIGDSIDSDDELYGEDDGVYAIGDEADETDGTVTTAEQSVTNTGSIGMGGALELKVVKPERYSNVQQIADHLLNHRTVVLNLESTNKETAKRLLDFLSGVAYSINGQLKRVATNTFVITPENVDVSGEQMRTASGEDTGNFTTTFGIAGDGKAASANTDSLY